MSSPPEREARLRAAVSRMGDRAIRSTVDSLTRRGASGLQPVERSALGALRSSRHPAQSVLRPHFAPAVEPLAVILGHECLEAIRTALGADAEEPTLDQLEAAVVEVGGRFTTETLALVLAATAASDAPAADSCDQILESHPELGLPKPEVAPGPQAAAEAPDQPPAGDQARPPRPKTGKASGRVTAKAVHKPWKQPKRQEEGATEEPAPVAGRRPAPTLTRRPPHLPPRYAETFDPADRWTGAVVLAEIAFAADDPHQAEFGAKRRPCVVVAGNADELLVRAGYTGRYQSESWRSTRLHHWRQAGLHKATWIETELRVVARRDADHVGWVDDEDWNHLW